MTQEELKQLTKKVTDGTSTPEEETKLLQELSRGIGALKDFIKIIKENNE